MVFCYKIVTESPIRSRCTSPRKGSPVGRFIPNSVSQLFGSFEEGTSKEELWNAIPERDWKLLAALARKREEESERERLAEQFQKMWLNEKEEREMVEAEISEQYKRYLHQKRSQERSHNEFKRLQRVTEQQLRRGQLMDSIRYKERRSADILAWREDKKIANLIGRSVEEECRIQLAKDKRYKLDIADKWSKEVELVYALKRADDANKRRNEMLKNASQRLAITNALTSWETSLIRQELAASHALKHANTLARVAMKQARSVQLTRARRSREARARHVAAISERMRDAVKRGS